MPSIQVGPWQVLPSEGGSSVAFSGEWMAVAGPARLNVWRGGAHVASANAFFPAPGTPRFLGRRVNWGAGFLDLDSGAYQRLEGAEPPPVPGAGERATIYAWAARSNRVLGVFGTPRSLRATLFNGETGASETTLAEGPGLAPSAAWLGLNVAVLGFANPKVFGLSGAVQAEIALRGGQIACIAATEAEDRMAIVDLNRAMYWIDTGSWTVLDVWPGPWLHGAVSDDGRTVAAIEPWGKLHVASVVADRFQSMSRFAVDDGAVTVALSASEIAIAGAGKVSRAEFTTLP
jgi:hypothetical protein